MQEDKKFYIYCFDCGKIYDLKNQIYVETISLENIPEGLCAKCWEDSSNPHFSKENKDFIDCFSFRL